MWSLGQLHTKSHRDQSFQNDRHNIVINKILPFEHLGQQSQWWHNGAYHPCDMFRDTYYNYRN